MHAMRIGIAETTCAVAIDRSCGGRCRGMLVGAPLPATVGTQGFPVPTGAREQGSAMGAPEARGSVGDGGAGKTRTQVGGFKSAED